MCIRDRDIIDLFPPGQKNPVRLELFDDTLTSIRAFDCVTQRSLEIMETFRIYPAAEVILTEADRRKGMARIEDELQRVTGRLNRQKGTAERLKEKVGRHLARMNQPVLEEAFYGYFPYFYARGDSLLDYLHNRYLVIIDDPARTAEAAQVLLNRGNDFQSDLLVQGDALSSETSLTWSFDELMARLKVPCLFLDVYKRQPSHSAGDWSLVFPLAKAAIAAGADGIIVEVHHNPGEALCDGSQSLTLESFRLMMNRLPAVAAAVDRKIVRPSVGGVINKEEMIGADG